MRSNPKSRRRASRGGLKRGRAGRGSSENNQIAMRLVQREMSRRGAATKGWWKRLTDAARGAVRL